MGLTAEPAWYVDAWSVLDGVAFASVRAPEAAEADVSVVIAPPDWSPVALARLSTGLAAGRRGHFQERLYSRSQEEIAFPSLEVLREVVRRAYLTGGLGLDEPGGAVPVPLPELPRLSPPGGIAEGPEEGSGPAWRELVYWKLLSVLRQDGVTDWLIEVAGKVSQSVEVWLEWHAESERPRQIDAIEWMRLAVTLFRHQQPARLPREYAETGLFEPWFASTTLAQPWRVLFRLPAVGPAFPDYPSPKGLTDNLLLSFASRRCFSALEHESLLLPVVFAAFVATLMVAGRVVLTPPHMIDLIHDTARWLTNQWPDDQLEQAGLEDVLEDVVQKVAVLRLAKGQGETPSKAFLEV